MTIEKCIEFCSNDGYAFAGVESEDQCFCGNNAPSQNPLPDSECNSKCSGDQTQICGGHWKINIYVGKIIIRNYNKRLLKTVSKGGKDLFIDNLHMNIALFYVA